MGLDWARASISRRLGLERAGLFQHKQVFLEPHLFRGEFPVAGAAPAVKNQIMYGGCNPKTSNPQKVPNMTKYRAGTVLDALEAI